MHLLAQRRKKAGNQVDVTASQPGREFRKRLRNGCDGNPRRDARQMPQQLWQEEALADVAHRLIAMRKSLRSDAGSKLMCSTLPRTIASAGYALATCIGDLPGNAAANKAESGNAQAHQDKRGRLGHRRWRPAQEA